MKRKAQAAMEYLMTYGWAILIIIVVAAALYSFGIFNPATWTGTRATGFANIGVPQDWQYTADTGNLQVIVRNGLGGAIDISTVSATCNTTGSFNVPLLGATGSLGAGLTRTYATEVNTTQCARLAPGSSFSVQLKVVYTPQGRSFTQTDTGTITGTAQ